MVISWQNIDNLASAICIICNFQVRQLSTGWLIWRWLHREKMYIFAWKHAGCEAKSNNIILRGLSPLRFGAVYIYIFLYIYINIYIYIYRGGAFGQCTCICPSTYRWSVFYRDFLSVVSTYACWSYDVIQNGRRDIINITFLMTDHNWCR